MNLRAFHAFLILLAAVLAAVLGVWCFYRYGQGRNSATLLAGFASLAVSAALVFYDRWFLRKTRELR